MEKIITAIEPQKRNQNRFNIFLNGEFAFGLSKSLVVQLKPGDPIETEFIEELLDKENFERAWQKAIHFLNYRARTEQELKEKMENLGFSEFIINQVVDGCKERGFINDRDFAEQWVETRTRNAPRSKKLMAVELKRKKVPEIEINKALSIAITDQDLAAEASKKIWRRLSTYNTEERKKKLQSYLLRRGFSYDVIHETINRMFGNDKTEE